MSERDVAVVLPVHNGARYLAESIESVLDQTLAPSEVVVVDDGSTDETPAVLESFGRSIRVITRPHEGYARAVNRGVAATTSPLVAVQDDDDVAVSTKLEVLVEAITADPRVDAVFGAVVQFVSPELDDATRRSFVFDPAPAVVELLTTGVFRRARWDALGGLDAGLVTAANVDWFSRMLAANAPIDYVDAIVYRRRLHESNVGVRLRELKRADLLTIVRSHVGRRRAGAVDVHE